MKFLFHTFSYKITRTSNSIRRRQRLYKCNNRIPKKNLLKKYRRGKGTYTLKGRNNKDLLNLSGDKALLA